ncbi:hypothetical protein [Alkalicoccobacillus gibsonii]|uniref:hypothetical protein n=1 Tax=Alkalicoccobacillus gibsonii TaxID=79881 RepID=UPI0035110641
MINEGGYISRKQCKSCHIMKYLYCFGKKADGFAKTRSICKMCKMKQNADYESREGRTRDSKLERKRRYQCERRTAERKLPHTLTAEQDAQLNNVCILSGATSNLQLEHFIPLSWGVAGTTFENCYYIEERLNYSKGNRNPFEWIETRFQDEKNRFYGYLVPMLAERNGMRVDEFISYVNNLYSKAL